MAESIVNVDKGHHDRHRKKGQHRKHKHHLSRNLMITHQIDAMSGRSKILIGESLKNLHRYFPGSKMVVITDSSVLKHHQALFPPAEVIELDSGEKMKSLETVRSIYSRLVALGADRSTVIVGIGGGVVCDITGFVASTYMRGLRFGFAATTLLAQVDASVGGKNGINFKGYKNIIGMFNQPEVVICDPLLLKSLPEREVLCGTAEIVKHALIRDSALLGYLETHCEKLIKLDPEIINHVVSVSVAIKSAIVNKDEHEHGMRRILNFGHTFGHGLEIIRQISHGEAVAAGMVIAARISAKKGHLLQEEIARIEGLLEKLKLPTQVSADRSELLDVLKKDKKRQEEGVYFVMLSAIGHAVVEKISFDELETLAEGIL
jgi:3-dehydroquinate synthase